MVKSTTDTDITAGGVNGALTLIGRFPDLQGTDEVKRSKVAWLDAYAHTRFRRDACKAASVPKSTFYDYLRNDPAFAKAVADTRIAFIDEVEDDTVDMARTQRDKAGVAAKIAVLKAEKPDKYGKLGTIEHRHTVQDLVEATPLDVIEGEFREVPTSELALMRSG